jgi:flagellar biosynthetic protein FliR
VGIAVVLSVTLLPLAGSPPLMTDVLSFILAASRELLVGLALGFTANLIFVAVGIAGEVADMQSGFAFTSLVDPTSEERISVIGQIQMMTAWLVFLVVNGHHVLIHGIAQSMSLLPIGTAALPAASIAGPVSLVTRTFIAALQIGAPVMGSALIADVALGMLARSVPQMNLLVIGFPIKMVVALTMLMVSLPVLIAAERSLVPMMDGSLHDLMSYLAGTP